MLGITDNSRSKILYVPTKKVIYQSMVQVFMQGGTKIETVVPKNQRTQRKILNFENRFNWEVSKCAKI